MYRLVVSVVHVRIVIRFKWLAVRLDQRSSQIPLLVVVVALMRLASLDHLRQVYLALLLGGNLFLFFARRLAHFHRRLVTLIILRAGSDRVSEH